LSKKKQHALIRVENEFIKSICQLLSFCFFFSRSLARFTDIILLFLASENLNPYENNNRDDLSKSKCLLFAPAEYFEDNSTKIQLARILSSSFRINTTTASPTDTADDPLATSQTIQPQQSPTSTQQPTYSAVENSPPLVYILCVPISIELEFEWRGVTHIIPENKSLPSIQPLHKHWKTTSIFLLTQQTNYFDKFEESFRERLSKIHIQQNDLYNFETTTKQVLQKHSCFEKVDNAMKNLAHSMLRLSDCIINNVEHFERMIEQVNTRDYVVSCHMILHLTSFPFPSLFLSFKHTEERAFAFGMDIIRETSFYATQSDNDTLKTQAERQLSFANVWLSFVRKKKSTTTSRYSITIPMWLLPGIHFLRHICALQFTVPIDNDFFSEFYSNMKNSIYYLSNTNENIHQENVRLKPIHSSALFKRGNARTKVKNKRTGLSRIEQLDRMDRRIDRRRVDDGLIGKIIETKKTPSLSKKVEEDLASLKIRNFHKLNLLSRGQFATSNNNNLFRNILSSSSNNFLSFQPTNVQLLEVIRKKFSAINNTKFHIMTHKLLQEFSNN